MDIKTLQVRLPWSDKYSADFRADPRPHKHFAHALFHVNKAAGKLAALVDNMDHRREDALKPELRAEAEKMIADLIICALRMANVAPGGPIDLERATVQRIETKNGVKITDEEVIRSTVTGEVLGKMEELCACLREPLAHRRGGLGCRFACDCAKKGNYHTRGAEGCIHHNGAV